jgi:hypothetical protein
VPDAPVFASAEHAAEVVRAGLGYLAAADATELAAETQARCLQMLEQVTSIQTAARASFLAAFTAGKGYCADADQSPRAWLMHNTRITRGAAASHAAWARRVTGHPPVMAALAAADLSESYARAICGWTDKLPGDCRAAADAILLAAAAAGMDLPALAGLAAEIYARSYPDLPGDRGDRDFDDRSVRLETTFEGAGVLAGDLTPECAAVTGAVLDALSAPRGAEDDRTHAQRYHDGLQEAMTRLVAAGLVPERAGQPVKALVHVSLAELLAMEGSTALVREWAAHLRAQWAGHRAAAAEGGGDDGGAWLDGLAAHAVTCDAAVIPVVTGDVDPAALEHLVRLCVQLGNLHHDPASGSASGPTGESASASAAREALEQAIIGTAASLLAGPGGLASFLRRRQLGAPLAGPSLPLDIGYAQTIPAGIRNAVLLRDRHCRFPRCRQRAATCQVHHARHQADGGKTSTENCILLCFFHHQVVIHRWGWTLTLNPDGTTTAWNPDRTKVLHSHGPPARAG